MRPFILITLALLINSQISLSQTSFHKTVGDTAENSANCIQHTSDGGYIVTGYTNDSAYDDFDVYLVKMDENFELEWTKTYGTTEGESGNSVIQTSDGGYVISGSARSGTPQQNKNVFVLKTDSTGNLEWSYVYDSDPYYSEKGFKILETSDGGFVIAVRRGLIKIDTNGILQWQSTFNLNINSMDVTSDGGYVFTGDGNGFPNSILLARMNSAGSLLWTHYYKDNMAAYGMDVASTGDGAFIVTGYGSTSTSNTATILMKADSAGNLLWYRKFHLQSHDSGYEIIESTDGGYAVMGRSYYGWSDAATLLKTDTSGTILWAKQYGSFSGDEWANSGLQTADGGYVITGFTFGFGVVAGDIYLVKTDSLGFTNCNEITATITQLSPNVTDTLVVPAIDTASFIATIHPVLVGSHGSDSLLCTLVGMEPHIEPSSVNIQISPNPSTGQFTITFNDMLKNGTIKIYNSLGELVYRNNFINGLSTEITDGNFSAGIYLVAVNENENYYFEKLIIN